MLLLKTSRHAKFHRDRSNQLGEKRYLFGPSDISFVTDGQKRDYLSCVSPITLHFIALRLEKSIMHQHTKILLNMWKGKTLFKEVWRTEAHHHAKLCRNWSIHPGDIVIFWFYKMAAIAILNIWICEFLLPDWVHGSKTHHLAKCYQNQLVRCRDIVLCFFQDGCRPPSWICLEHIWTTHGKYSVVSITEQNLVVINRVVLVIWTFQYLIHLAGNVY